MSWLCTLTSAVLAGALLISPAARASGIETAVMPGPVIQGHADSETQCSACHLRFDRAAQPGLCLDCHKDVRADVKAGAGYHGRLAESARECRKCHTDHKGRQARIVVLDESRFDHGQTDFQLMGKHRLQTCAGCHRPRVRYSQAPSECFSCHRKDDKHHGGLGVKCAECHTADTWKDGRFDHARTRFPLRRSHADARLKCESCHAANRFANTPQDCASCHRDDDMKNGHKGQFGARCERCHDEGSWKTPGFRHDRDTRFTLLDRHRLVKCESCHRAPLYREKTSARCVSCHKAEDVHQGSLGDKCDKCHGARGWKGTAFDHDTDTGFALRDRHKSARCDSCHKEKGMRDRQGATCFDCHERDDREKGHKGSYGEKCESCHHAAAFKPSTFNHTRDTSFAVDGKHGRLSCSACHKAPLYRSRTDSACYSCHKDQDVHFSTYGLECGGCHVAEDWRRIRADAPVASKPDGGAPARPVKPGRSP